MAFAILANNPHLAYAVLSLIFAALGGALASLAWDSHRRELESLREQQTKSYWKLTTYEREVVTQFRLSHRLCVRSACLTLFYAGLAVAGLFGGAIMNDRVSMALMAFIPIFPALFYILRGMANTAHIGDMRKRYGEDLYRKSHEPRWN